MNKAPDSAHNTTLQEDLQIEAMLPLVYKELRRLAANHMSLQSPDHTLQPTALVHEAWIRLARSENIHWQGRSSFLSMASTAMRHILIDHARNKSSQKRGGDRQRVEPEIMNIESKTTNETLLLVNDALKQLERSRPEWARIVEMKFFGGMTNKEVADVLGKSPSTVERYWTAAKAWLHKQLLAAK